jgi:hypothetical protein
VEGGFVADGGLIAPGGVGAKALVVVDSALDGVASPALGGGGCPRCSRSCRCRPARQAQVDAAAAQLAAVSAALAAAIVAARRRTGNRRRPTCGDLDGQRFVALFSRRVGVDGHVDGQPPIGELVPVAVAVGGLRCTAAPGRQPRRLRRPLVQGLQHATRLRLTATGGVAR